MLAIASTFCYPLEQVIQVEVFFFILSEGTSEHAQFISNASETPHITLPVIPFALKHLRTHVQRSPNTTESFERLGTQLTTQT